MSFTTDYRPQRFTDVLGNEINKKILTEQMYSRKFPRAYILAGPFGSGKTTFARLIAKAINCENLSPNGDPCCECKYCKGMEQGRLYGYQEINGADYNSVDHAREIVQQTMFKPVGVFKKVIVWDEFHRVTTNAQDALLKTVEENDTTIFIFATTDPDKIIKTIKSRSLSLKVRKPKYEDIFNYLVTICNKNKLSFTNEGLDIIIKYSKGHMRDALMGLEQCSGSQITRELASDILNFYDMKFYFDLLEATFKSVDDFESKLGEAKEAQLSPHDIFNGIVEALYHIWLYRAGGKIDFDKDVKDFLKEVNLSESQIVELLNELHRMANSFTFNSSRIIDLILTNLNMRYNKKFIRPVAVNKTVDVPGGRVLSKKFMEISNLQNTQKDIKVGDI